MNKFSFTQSENARTEALNFIKNSLTLDQWNLHQAQIQLLKQSVEQHALFQHPILNQLQSSTLSLHHLKTIHLNYFVAIVKIFTDALSMLIFDAHTLEKNQNIKTDMRVKAKVYARYLLSLNLIDELGFNTLDLALSSPSKAHLTYFLQLLEALSLDTNDLTQTVSQAHRVSDYIASHFHDYQALLLILAITEQQVIVYSEALSINVAKFDPKFSSGYYECHGVVGCGHSLANDDNHEDDIWMLLTQALDTSRTDELSAITHEFLDIWHDFWESMYVA